jgi:two-component system response regulator AtoC
MSNVLVVDDDRSVLELIEAGLTQRGIGSLCRSTGEAALRAVASEPLDAVVTDLRLDGMDGLELCQRIVEARADLPVVVLTAHGNMDTAVAAIRAGASDFMTKPFELAALLLVLERVIHLRRLGEEVKRLRRSSPDQVVESGMVGASPAMRKVFDLLDRVAELDASVLVMGETGTGKELVARALHRRGRRRAQPFIAVNCAAIPEALLESELFGHAKGAFTDARSAHAGLFVQAHGGTLFLDEVTSLSLALQPKLLRALQERAVRPVGGTAEIPCDVRVVAACNRPLLAEVERGTFREDLFYRLDVIGLELPPLRGRGNDVLLLAQRFIEEFSAQVGKQVIGLSQAAAGMLLNYGWPGNVRELRNCMERAVSLTDHELLAASDLPERIQRHRMARLLTLEQDPLDLQTMAEVEQKHILRVLKAAAGNKTVAAGILGLHRRTLYRKLKEYNWLPVGKD